MRIVRCTLRVLGKGRRGLKRENIQEYVDNHGQYMSLVGDSSLTDRHVTLTDVMLLTI